MTKKEFLKKFVDNLTHYQLNEMYENVMNDNLFFGSAMEVIENNLEEDQTFYTLKAE